MTKKSAKMMFVILSILTVFSLKASASKETGLGFIIFGPTGLSVQHYLSNANSIDGALSGTNGSLYLHSTYLWHRPKQVKIDSVRLDLYFGGGLRGIFNDQESILGLRAPIGLSYVLPDPTVQFFGELAIQVDFLNRFGAGATLGLGARYFF